MKTACRFFENNRMIIRNQENHLEYYFHVNIRRWIELLRANRLLVYTEEAKNSIFGECDTLLAI